MYNLHTGKVFTRHYDPIKGVGQKFNLSGGFVSSVSVKDIKDHLLQPPCYAYYTHMFGDCDYFNTFLKRACWPHKRGGNGLAGVEGAHHDFVMASMGENLYHMFLAVNEKPKAYMTMQSFLVKLSNVIIMHAKSLDPKK